MHHLAVAVFVLFMILSVSGADAQSKPPPRDVQLLELEMAVASYGLVKSPQNKQKLVEIYHRLLNQDCMAGDPRTPLEQRKLTFETDCLEFLKGLLEVDEKDSIAICLKEGSISKKCRNAQSGIFDDHAPENSIDALEKYLSMPQQTIVPNPANIEYMQSGQPPPFIPDMDKLTPAVQELQATMLKYQGSPSDEHKASLIEVFQRYVLLACPDPIQVLSETRFAGYRKTVPEECVEHGKTLLTFDPNSSLAKCFTEGYTSAPCKEYVKAHLPPSKTSSKALEKF